MSVISVIIPSFRPEDYIIDCLCGLENQTLSKDLYKVYIGLNGPREDYEKYLVNILTNFTFAFDFYYISDIGVSAARNYLLDISHEQYVVFIDDDDIVSPDYLKALLAVSSKNVMAISYIKNFRGEISNVNDNYIGKTFMHISDMTYSKFKTRKYFSSPWGKMIPRDAIASFRFDPSLAKGEDSLFMALIAKNIKLIKKSSISACYYVNERNGSVTRKKLIFIDELRWLNYLMLKYTNLLFTRGYDKVFILTRIVATSIKYFKILKGL